MNKKIGRNDSCPCGSGKKYKYCCLGKRNPKDNDEQTTLILSKYNSAKHNSKIEYCTCSQLGNCSKDIIRAHSIQDKKLQSLMEEGKVISFNSKKNPYRLDEIWGHKEASTFYGFCGYHDKKIFQPIEDCDFVASKEQIFLYTYRAFAYGFYTLKKDTLFQHEFDSNSYLFTSGLCDSFELNKDIDALNNAIKNTNYEIVTSIIRVFPFAINFAASGMERPERDLQGRCLPDIDLDDDRLPGFIIYNVFSENDKTYVIISWLKFYNELYAPIKAQLESLTDLEFEYYISQTIPMITDNIYIKPSAWNTLSEHQKEKIHQLSNDMSKEHLDKYKNPQKRLLNPGFNLFEM